MSIEGVQKLVVIRNYVAIWGLLGRVGKSGLRGVVRRSRSWQTFDKAVIQRSQGCRKVDGLRRSISWQTFDKAVIQGSQGCRKADGAKRKTLMLTHRVKKVDKWMKKFG